MVRLHADPRFRFRNASNLSQAPSRFQPTKPDLAANSDGNSHLRLFVSLNGGSRNGRLRPGLVPRARLCRRGAEDMIKFLLWCILLVLCWPLALAALVLYPLVWLVLLPFRIVGIAVGGALELVAAIIFLPVRILKTI
jgi:hypothetical protein